MIGIGINASAPLCPIPGCLNHDPETVDPKTLRVETARSAFAVHGSLEGPTLGRTGRPARKLVCDLCPLSIDL